MQRITLIGFVVLTWFGMASAQTKPDSLVGAIIELDRTSRTATLKTDSGESVRVTIDDATACLRIPSGERTLSKAEPIKFDDIAIADRVLAHGTKTNEGFKAQRLVVMPVAEIAKKREHDLDDWKRRGIGGVVREVNAQTGEITLELRGPNAGTRLPIETGKAGFRRYVAGSLRFEDARPSQLSEVHIGDQLRVLGDKAGANFVAEQIVSGAFKTVGITVVAVDQQQGEIHATTLDQKKPVTVFFNKDSVLRRISPSVATAIAQKTKGDAGKAASAPTGPKPAQPVIDVQQMIDTLPAISLSDLKAGDVLAVTGALETDESHLVAIKAAAGVDLVLRALASAPGRPQSVRLSAGLPPGFDFSVIPVN